VILLGGYLLFESDPGVVSIGGAVVALSGMSVYTSLNLQEPQEPSSKPKSTSEDTKSTDSNVNTTTTTTTSTTIVCVI